MTLREYIEANGYTVEEYEATVDMLCNKGIPNGCYQNTSLLILVLGLITNLDREVEV